MRKASWSLILLTMLLAFATPLRPSSADPAATTMVYLPVVRDERALRRVNAPYFNGAVRFPETAIFWFGRISQAENYADVRVGYNDTELYLYLAAFDRRIWYDTTPSLQDLIAWDAATLYLDIGGAPGAAPGASSYQFVTQFSNGGSRSGYQAAYRGNGSGWAAAAIPFTTLPGWRGDAPNNNGDDRGWAMTFHIPFTGLGLAGPPPQGTTWRMAVMLHDRDDATGTPIAASTWPEAVTSGPISWGQLGFGMPIYSPPPATPRQTLSVRHKLNGATVEDGDVGGDTNCGNNLDLWTQWGAANHAGGSHINIQNQSDVSDWPCFSKTYITFPLDAVPAGKSIISATLTLQLFGNAGGPGEAKPSLIQVSTVAESWNEQALTWNNAPLAEQNIGAAWVNPVAAFPGWPGVPWTWDVSRAVAEAYASGAPVRLALYSADSDYHSGKYFVTSETGDWNEVARPTLQVRWGDP